MKASKLFLRTYKENPANSDSINHSLLVRAGMVYQNGNGLFSLLPLGLKIMQKIEQTIREEMSKINAQESILPLLSSRQVWERAGRWNAYGPEMIRVKDRRGREYALVPTAEADFTSLIDKDINSYKDFPMILYQIGDKFRDEIRPRFGLLRARQFKMKDAYSFHATNECLDRVFQDFKQAYINIFTRLGLTFKICEADTGAIGGRASLEFIVMTDSGEAEVLYCSCGYAANAEKASNFVEDDKVNNKVFERISTPGCETIDEVSRFLGLDAKNTLKSLIVKSEGKYYLIILRGDRQLNEAKLSSFLGAEFEYATDEEMISLGLVKGYIGPTCGLTVLADEEAILGSKCAGANQKDYHLINLQHGRDWRADRVADLRLTESGDACPKCREPLLFMKGIEVGHIFKIGEKYSEAMNVNFISESGVQQKVLMASYGIGVSRLLATLVEQNYDSKGIIWPIELAPFRASIIIPQRNNLAYAEELYSYLKSKGIDVLLDERDLSLGYKMKDSDLIGIPFKIIVGNSIKNGEVEIISRRGEETKIQSHDFDSVLSSLTRD